MDGVISEEGVEMTTQVIQFYKTLFQETKNRRPFVEGLEFDQIGGMERVWMEIMFEKEEILSVIKKLEGDKAPGLDGFSMAFIHHRSRVVHVLAVFEEFY